MTGPRIKTPSDQPRTPRAHGGGRPVIDLAGQRLNRLLVIERAPKPVAYSLSPASGVWWNCECDCGRQVVLRGERLRAGITRDCGGAWHTTRPR